MRGPFAPGTHAHFQQSPDTILKLRFGHFYRIKTAFADADGTLHEEGEAWRLIVSMYSIYYEELVLAVCFIQGGEEWQIPLSDRYVSQQNVIQKPLHYFEEVPSQ